ncbi:MAG: class A beta-lactamase-related serine hydrolase [Gemmatimonadetes bacterium]|nr:class A beta-lactamase-related serine hydrolase [Gemmatimonadota bacterium]
MIAVLFAIATAQVAQPDSIGPRLQHFADSLVAARPKLPGLILYVKDGRSGRQWRIASGWSDTARRVRLDPGQPLRIASNTKTYVAAAVLRLVERGTLQLSDPLSRHLPADLNAMLVGDGYATDRMTIEQVLSHRSGLNEHPAVASYAAVALAAPKKRWTREEQVRWLVDSLQPVGEPGERYRYSDTGYILLGAILERYTGKNVGVAVRELVDFKKLGLVRTWFETLEPEPNGAGPRVHQYIGGFDSYELDPSFDLYGGGGIDAPLDEMGGFLEELLSGRVFARPATLETMLKARSPDRGGYGLGIFQVDTLGHHGYGHAGFWGTVGYYFPASRLTVAAAVTEQTEGRVAYAAVPAVLAILFPKAPRS